MRTYNLQIAQSTFIGQWKLVGFRKPIFSLDSKLLVFVQRGGTRGEEEERQLLIDRNVI